MNILWLVGIIIGVVVISAIVIDIIWFIANQYLKWEAMVDTEIENTFNDNSK